LRSPLWTQLSLILAQLEQNGISPRLCFYLAIASSGLLLLGQSSTVLLNQPSQQDYRPLLSQQPPQITSPVLPSPQLPSPATVLNLSRAEQRVLNQLSDRRWDGRQWYLSKSRQLRDYLSTEDWQRRETIAANPLRYPSKADYLALKQSQYRQVVEQEFPIQRLILGSSIALGIPDEFLSPDDLNLGIPAAYLQDTLQQVQTLDENRRPDQIILFGAATPELLKQASVSEIQEDARAVLNALSRKYPQVPIIVVSVLPRSPSTELTHPHMERVDNTKVRRLNRNLAHLFAQHPQIRFLDLNPYITDDDGYLKRDFSTDGLHANALTALVLIKLLQFSDRLDSTFYDTF
jgi:lysophospholipase L1-like esterase